MLKIHSVSTSPPPLIFITPRFPTVDLFDHVRKKNFLMLYKYIVSYHAMNLPTTSSPILYSIKVLYTQ